MCLLLHWKSIFLSLFHLIIVNLSPNDIFQLSFEVEIPPVAIVTYLIESVSRDKLSRISVSNITMIRDKIQLEQTLR